MVNPPCRKGLSMWVLGFTILNAEAGPSNISTTSNTTSISASANYTWSSSRLTSTVSTTLVGEYVLQGLGGTTQSPTTSSTWSAQSNNSASTTPDTRPVGNYILQGLGSITDTSSTSSIWATQPDASSLDATALSLSQSRPIELINTTDPGSKPLLHGHSSTTLGTQDWATKPEITYNHTSRRASQSLAVPTSILPTSFRNGSGSPFATIQPSANVSSAPAHPWTLRNSTSGNAASSTTLFNLTSNLSTLVTSRPPLANATVTQVPNSTADPTSVDVIELVDLLGDLFSLTNFTTYAMGGSAYISCFTEWVSWKSTSVISEALFTYTNTTPGTYTTATLSLDFVWTDISWPTTSVPTYTLCDGTPRADVKAVTSTITSSLVWRYRQLDLYHSPPPTCTMDPYACVWLIEHTSLSDDSIDNLINWIWLASLCSDWNLQPADGSTCVVRGGPIRESPRLRALGDLITALTFAEMLYWPVTTIDGNLCQHNGSTITGTPTGVGPNTYVTLGLTLTSPTVYLSFETLHADIAGYSGAFTGPTFANTIIPFPASDISSQCVAGGAMRNLTGPRTFDPLGPATRLDYADLNYPIAANVHQCATLSCDPNTYSYTLAIFNTSTPLSDWIIGSSTMVIHQSDVWCFTIFDDYDPMLAAPTALTTLIPEWSQCVFNNSFIAQVQSCDPVRIWPCKLTIMAWQQYLYNSVLAGPTTPSPVSAELTSSSQQGPSTPAAPSSTRYTAVQETAQPKTSEGLSTTILSSGLLAASAQSSTTLQSLTVVVLSPTSSGSSLNMPTAPSPVDSNSRTGPEAPNDSEAGSSTDAAGAIVSVIIGQGSAQSKPITTSDAAGAIVSIILEQGPALSDPASSDAAAPTIVSAVKAVGPSTQTVAPTLAAVTLGRQTLTAVQDPSDPSLVAIAGKTLTQGGAKITLASHTLSLGSAGIVVDQSSTAALTGAQPQQHPGAIIGSAVAALGAAAATAQTVTIAGRVLTIVSNGVVVDGTSTLSLGKPATSLAPTLLTTAGHLVMDGSETVAFPSITPHPSTMITVGDTQYTIGTAPGEPEAAVVNGIILRPGQAATISGHVFSDGPSGLIVDGTSTVPLADPAAPMSTTFTMGNKPYTIAAAPGDPSAALVDGVTLTAGQVATLAGHVFSKGSGGVVIDGTRTVALPGQLEAYTTLATAGQLLTIYTRPGSDGVQVVNGVTLYSGQVVTVAGQLISNGPFGLVVGSTSTVALPVASAVFTVSGEVLTALAVPGSPGVEVVNGVTISMGQSATIDGDVISNGAFGLLIDGMTTVATPTAYSGAAVPAIPITFTISGQVYTANGVFGRPGLEVINGITLSPGQAATLSGHVFSDLAGVDGLLVDDTSTVLPPPPGSVTPGPVGRVGTAGASSAEATTTSGARRQRVEVSAWLVLIGSVLALMLAN
ncbi:hypothetical protein LTR53_011945 [Teratosphaeriaceae sp. CCFEE 6253]|nr:hypothetical protein LTR53_011945 [Teratosphaeriaceae sp. CCFEE 6253]